MMTSPYLYDVELLREFLELAFTYKGKVYGGFVRDFIVRDYLRQHDHQVDGVSIPFYLYLK